MQIHAGVVTVLFLLNVHDAIVGVVASAMGIE